VSESEQIAEWNRLVEEQIQLKWKYLRQWQAVQLQLHPQLRRRIINYLQLRKLK
jgi:hypothetical protein